MKLKYTSRAIDDLELAFVWYERQRRGLGFEFLDCVENTLASILRSPKLYRVCYTDFRGALIRRFPFQSFIRLKINKL